MANTGLDHMIPKKPHAAVMVFHESPVPAVIKKLSVSNVENGFNSNEEISTSSNILPSLPFHIV
jgi:hypothetical protein